MSRPGPLQELPLEHFLPPNPNLPNSSKSRPNKRPLSPGGPSLFSPAKRRILNDEGVFFPERTPKSPLGRGTPARFAQVLSGPGSPARKLDFGAPKHVAKCSTAPHAAPLVRDATPTRELPSSSRLAPSPEFKHASLSQQDQDQEMDDYFGLPSLSSNMQLSTIPSVITRDMPPPSDPQSIHYPGFRVHYDIHISRDVLDSESIALEEKDKDGRKENLAPRRRPHKTMTAPNPDMRSQILSPDARKRELEKLGRIKSTPATPKKALGGDRQSCVGSPTPQRPIFGMAGAASTTRLVEMERIEMRRVLQDETDDVEIDEDDIAF